MKRNIKITFKTIFIIILFVFVVIPLLLKILEYKEGFRTEVSSTHSDYNIDLKKRYNNVDRIKDSDNNSTYKYCIGGIIKCKGSESNATLDEISNSYYTEGKTYEDKCLDGNGVICDKSIFYKDVDSVSDISGVLGVNSDGTDVDNRGFTKSLSYYPIGLINNYTEKIKRWNPLNSDSYSQNNLSDYKFISKCDFESKEDGSYNECIKHFGVQEDISGNDSSIKCLADFGTQVGENICCGQEGILQNTKYVCPSEYPICGGYKCGESWGYCKS